MKYSKKTLEVVVSGWKNGVENEAFSQKFSISDYDKAEQLATELSSNTYYDEVDLCVEIDGILNEVITFRR